MNNENYIVINGKKTELTDEQLKQLGIKIETKRNNPFDIRANYYFINYSDNIVTANRDDDFISDVELLYKNSNYFNDKTFAKQVMLHQQLYRKLLEYSYNNNAEVSKEDWHKSIRKYCVCYDYIDDYFSVDTACRVKDMNTVYFKNSDIANQAIKDVIEPFMRLNPEFVW